MEDKIVRRRAWDDTGKVVYVLGLDYEVKDCIEWEKAVTAVLQGKMTPFMVHETKRIHSAGRTVDMAWPLIVRLNYWVDIPRQPKVELNSRANRHQILRRDGKTCGYCGDPADTVDHVKPESRCKKDKDPHNGWTWGNLVAACFSCNQKKRNMTPEEAGMTLLWSPHAGSKSAYADVQKEVWSVLQTGEGYVTENTHVEGILK